MLIGCGFRFTIDAHYLLPPGMGHARKNARLRGSCVVLVFQNACNWDLLMAESTQQKATRIVVADNSHRQNIDPEVREIVGGVRSATGNNDAFAMAKDEHRRLSRHARNFPD